MPPHLGAPYNPTPSAWGYADQQHAPMTGAAPSMNLGAPPVQPVRQSVVTIFDVTPQQGYEGTVIRITCDLQFRVQAGDTSANRIRVLFGSLEVEPSVGPNDNNYVITLVAPPVHQTGCGSWSVPIILDAFDEQGFIERANVCDFHYIDPNSGTPKRGARRKLENESPVRKPLSTPRGPGPIRRRGGDDMGYPAIAAGAAASFVYDSPPQQSVHNVLPHNQPGLVRTTQMIPGAASTNPYMMRTKARLEIDGDLNAMKSNWSQEMWNNRRCLVQFTRRQEGAIVRASFKAVEESDWTPNMIVISCLYHDARNECYFTSVDAIYLLECLMGTRYTTEEKNRIRRNLESFKPTTLQKNEGQWQDFYAHIMNYPNPKPRNIDKGLKVFPWVHLEQALKKIFANYSAFLNIPTSFSLVNSEPTHVPYGHQSHPSQDSISYPGERTVMHHARPSAGSLDDISAYVDMSPVATNPTPPYGHRSLPSSGGSASATSELVPPYSTANTADGDFNKYVNMSPTAASTVPRETYNTQLGLYVPSQVDPALGPSSGTSDPLAYGASRPPNSDLRVAYEGSASTAPYPPP